MPTLPHLSPNGASVPSRSAARPVCSWHGVGNDPVYSGTLCFDTFPFPFGLTLNIPASAYAEDPHAQAIADVARKLNELRENWLNPPEWVDRVPKVVPGYPDRLILIPGRFYISPVGGLAKRNPPKPQPNRWVTG
ncbi:MAG: hypothetical protein WAW42_14175 [Candidatus Competibacteraceae bacterium]